MTARMRARHRSPSHRAPVALALVLCVLGCGSGSGSSDDSAGGAASAGEREAAATAEADERRPRQVIVLVDLSASQTLGMLEEARRFLDAVVDRLSFGDRIAFIEVHQTGVRDAARRWADSLPRPADPGFVSSRDRTRLQGVRDAASSVADVFFDSTRAGRGRHTDLFATLHIAAEYLRNAGDRETVLVLLSDMLQSANGIEMEGLRSMPPTGWIQRQQAAGLLPALRGACVLVVGADATTPEGSAVRDFWLAYFEAAGARLGPGNYRLLAPGEVECGGVGAGG